MSNSNWTNFVFESKPLHLLKIVVSFPYSSIKVVILSTRPLVRRNDTNKLLDKQIFYAQKVGSLSSLRKRTHVICSSKVLYLLLSLANNWIGCKIRTSVSIVSKLKRHRNTISIFMMNNRPFVLKLFSCKSGNDEQCKQENKYLLRC